ncbi:MAG: hypothetical protein IKT43_00105, partial [Clostridia bacterium]|nr:hypothetical protein [Clostridia bacterium]
MTTKETASALWQNLNQGLDALYQKYKNLKASSKTDYEAKIAAVDPQYDTLKNQAASQNKIAKANTDRRMAESGLAASGEALRRSLLQDAALQQNLTSLDLSARAEKSALRQDYDKALLELEAKEQDEVSKYT